MIVRIEKSWISPHMVSFRNRTRFYSRNSSTGKVILDVQQIGAAFSGQRELGERLQRWKADRISKSLAHEGPVDLNGPRILLHFIPIGAIASDEQAAPRRFDRRSWGGSAQLMSLSPQESRYNADGYLLPSQSPAGIGSYLQVFRKGILEYGDSYALNPHGGDKIPSQVVERKIVEAYIQAIALLNALGVDDPVYASLALVQVRNRTMAVPGSLMYDFQCSPFDREVIQSPDVLVERSNAESHVRNLLPLLDSIWQAAGRESTPYRQYLNVWAEN